MKTSITRKEIAAHNISRAALALALICAPITTFAYTQNLNDLVHLSVGYFNQAIYLIIAIAVLVFVWNIYQYFFKADPENKKDAALYVMYSVIGFFVIISFWGLVNILSGTFRLNTNSPDLNFFGTSLSNPGSSGSGSSFPTFVPAPSNSAAAPATDGVGASNSPDSSIGPGAPSDPLPDQTTGDGDITS